jgi:hydroxypyruvate reductase 1
MAMAGLAVQIYNGGGDFRVVSTKPMPGTQWIRALTNVGCRVEASACGNSSHLFVVAVA